MLLIIAFWVFLCVLAGMFASNRRKRDGIGWFLVALFFSPLVAFLLLLVLNESDGINRGPAWLVGSNESRPWSSSRRWPSGSRRGTWPSGAPR